MEYVKEEKSTGTAEKTLPISSEPPLFQMFDKSSTHLVKLSSNV